MSWKKTLIAAAIMIAATGIMRYVSHSEEIHPNQPFSTFPQTIGEWKGKEVFFSDQVYQMLGVDDSFIANYKGPNGESIQLYIGFYQSQKEGEMPHSPKVCLPGAGWGIKQMETVSLNIPQSPRNKSQVLKMVVENRQKYKQMVFYWFHSRGRMITSEYMQRFYLALDAITRQRTDGAFVRLITPVINGDEQAALETLNAFTAKIMPILDRYIPS